jgi:mitochondrial fission protein ELM1
MKATPRVWVLLGKGTGGNMQMKSLADALDWPYETKQLVYGRLSACPNLLLRASRLGIDRKASSPLSAPWPDLLIAGSRRSSPVALWIKRQSRGATRLVHLMHTQAPLAWFDLVITTPQYGLPRLPNVLHNTVPLNVVPRLRLADAAAHWRPRLEALPRPFTALLVGGNSSSYVLDRDTALRLGREASAAVRGTGGSLLISTSARTPDEATRALLAAIDVPSYVYQWRPNDAENPYHAYLALADRFIVTADSASLLAEACATAKPVQVFEWLPRSDRARGVRRLLRHWGETSRHRRDECGTPSDLRARLYDRLVYLGLVKPPRDFEAFREALRKRGLLTRLGETESPFPPQPLDDMQRAVARVREIMSPSATDDPER